MADTANSILVIGGGIAGITVAVEAAECGRTVYLVERDPSLGGRVARMNKYFPKLCPPYCGLEINFRRIKANPNIIINTLSEVTNIEGSKGDFTVTIKKKPRFVNAKCVACRDCEPACPVSRPDDFNANLSETKAIYLPHMMAMPARHVIDMSVCEGESCSKCVEACEYDAIDLAMKEEEVTVNVASIVHATGWKPYDANKIDNLGFGEIENVISNVQLERLAAPNGPTAGKILRQDNNEAPSKVVFVQCAGSRDENNLAYCSSVCCMASLKQATYVREALPDSEVTIFYIDLRAPGKYERFYNKVAADDKVTLVKGKIAKAERNDDGSVKVTAEDILNGERLSVNADLVILATGMEPEGNGAAKDENGFTIGSDGIFVTGVAKRAVDVATTIQDATGVALKAIQCGVNR